MSVLADAGAAQRRATILRTTLELAVVAVFVLLIWNNYTLRRQQGRSVATGGKTSQAFAARERIGVIPAVTLDGARRDLDLRNARAIVAVVNPTCESCRAMLQSVGNAPDVHVLSVAPLDETRTMARQMGLGANTRVVVNPIPPGLQSRLNVYPQLVVFDRGQVVRTCTRIEECR